MCPLCYVFLLKRNIVCRMTKKKTDLSSHQELWLSESASSNSGQHELWLSELAQ